MKAIALANHLSPEELEQHYRKAKDPVERGRWQVLWLIAQGYSRVEIAKITRYTASWITAIIKRYNAQGVEGVHDQRHRHPGPPRLLTPALREELVKALEQNAPDGGFWTGPKVALWMSEKLARPIHPSRGWEALRALDYRLIIPRPRHRKADPQAQEEFKKTLPEEIARIKAAHPNAEVELWAEDEHRIGLKPILRRIWAKKGSQPRVTVEQRYQWTYLYAFVCAQSGQTFWLLAPSANSRIYTRVLEEFAREQGVGPTKQIAIVLDRAGWHRSTHLKIPQGIHFIFLPPSSPELQPAERLWQLSDQAIANRHFADIDQLEQAQAERCRWLYQQPQLIRAYTLFHWWPRTHTLTV